MMQECCGSYQCYSAGECSCGSNSFHAQNNYYNFYETSETYSFDPSSPVDCTLSLGTPSTRMTEYDEKRREEQQSANYSWELPRPKHAPSSKRSGRGGGAEKSNANSDRHCASCDTTTTPLWRNGPSGPKSLCNACGIRYKKEERKAASSGQGSSIYRNEAADSWLPHNHNHSQRTQRFSHGVANDINPSVAFLSWSLNDSEQPQIYYNFTT